MESSRIIDMRSDTVTQPTEEMREAAKNAIVGDDVFYDDPTVIRLETYAAELLDKEAALFVSSGTQGNLVSVLSQTRPGDQVLLEEKSHLLNYEVGGLSAVGGTIAKPLPSDQGFISPQLIETIASGYQAGGKVLQLHFPMPKLLCVENTHNGHGGKVLSPDQIQQMADAAHRGGMKVHLDGARIFNACASLNVDVKEFTAHVDSVQICLSKGLSAPIGSIVAGTQQFIDLARKKRKMLGGGMRQVGIIAAPAMIALRDMRDRLVEDNAHAKTLAAHIETLGLHVNPTESNIVICNIPTKYLHANDVVKELGEHNILIVAVSSTQVRFTTHRHVGSKDISTVCTVLENQWK